LGIFLSGTPTKINFRQLLYSQKYVWLIKYSSGDGARKNEMGGARDMCVLEERYIEDVGAEALREIDHLFDLIIDGMLILKHPKKWVCMTWAGLICLKIGTVGRQAF
jgi:hypothetical protein